jgi:beta-lactamase regulating signal transducer with metallopeptidase domain
MDIPRALLQTTLYTGVLFGCIMLLKKAFRAKMSPALHLGIWILFAARLLMPAAIDGGFHFFTLPAAETAIEEQVSAAPPQGIQGARPPAPQTQQDTAAGYRPVETMIRADAAVAGPATDAAPPYLSLERGLLILWPGGAAAYAVILIAGALRMKKILRTGTSRAPRSLCDLFESCRRELGIKRHIRIFVAHGIPSPALLFPNTILMPADTLLRLDHGQTRLVLLHELTHCKRGDHITSLVLLCLRAVYWFNPFIWLACPQIKNDMETACDNDVVQRIGPAGRDAYAKTVLALFARGASPAVLGMALTDTRKTAEQRIRGIYMKSRTGKRVKAAAMLLACLLVVACFTTACQPVRQPPEPPAETAPAALVDVPAKKTAPPRESSAPQTTASPYAAPQAGAAEEPAAVPEEGSSAYDHVNFSHLKGLPYSDPYFADYGEMSRTEINRDPKFELTYRGPKDSEYVTYDGYLCPGSTSTIGLLDGYVVSARHSFEGTLAETTFPAGKVADLIEFMAAEIVHTLDLPYGESPMELFEAYRDDEEYDAGRQPGGYVREDMIAAIENGEDYSISRSSGYNETGTDLFYTFYFYSLPGKGIYFGISYWDPYSSQKLAELPSPMPLEEGLPYSDIYYPDFLLIDEYLATVTDGFERFAFNDNYAVYRTYDDYLADGSLTDLRYNNGEPVSASHAYISREAPQKLSGEEAAGLFEYLCGDIVRSLGLPYQSDPMELVTEAYKIHRTGNSGSSYSYVRDNVAYTYDALLSALLEDGTGYNAFLLTTTPEGVELTCSINVFHGGGYEIVLAYHIV